MSVLSYKFLTARSNKDRSIIVPNSVFLRAWAVELTGWQINTLQTVCVQTTNMTSVYLCEICACASPNNRNCEAEKDSCSLTAGYEFKHLVVMFALCVDRQGSVRFEGGRDFQNKDNVLLSPKNTLCQSSYVNDKFNYTLLNLVHEIQSIYKSINVCVWWLDW